MLNFNAWKLTQRYVLVIVAYWISFMAVAAVGWMGLVNGRDGMRSVHEDLLQRILQAEVVTESVMNSRMQVLLAFQHAPDSTLASVHEHPTSQHLDAVRSQLQRGTQVQQALLALLALRVEADEQAMLQTMAAGVKAWTDKVEGYTRSMEGGVFTPALMQAFLATGREQGDTLIAHIKVYKDFQVKKADAAYQAAESQYRTGVWVFILAVLLGGVPATALSWSLMRRMREGFAQAQAVSQAIAQGDLSQRVQSAGQDEISTLLTQMEQMRTHLHQIVAQVRTGADAIAGASTQVAAGTQDLSARTEQQAASLEETAAATEQLSSTVQNNADNAERARELASSATHVAQQGGTMVAQVVQTMEEINASSRKIEDIISVIDGIAFQTNILALNAAVEAARAGEQGRGFAVVAGEVRSLAQRSAEAAKEVKALITASVDRVRTGTEQVDRAGATMQDIVQGIERVAHIVVEISDASREQARGLDQINMAVTNLDDVTQQNAALVEETSAASSSLQEQARQLAGMASRFVLEHGSAAPSKPRLPQAGPQEPSLRA